MRTLGLVLASVAAMVVAACSSEQSAPASTPATTAAAAAPATQAPVRPPPPAPLVLGPGDPRFLAPDLPPLPDNLPFAPRPAEYVRTVYTFAARHADVLRYVPCFCGCERLGHRANDECFVARRNGSGQVVEWQPHGVICEVCLDVAHEAMQLHNTGASITQIRAEIDRTWDTPGSGRTHTPTPPPHGGGE